MKRPCLRLILTHRSLVIRRMFTVAISATLVPAFMGQTGWSSLNSTTPPSTPTTTSMSMAPLVTSTSTRIDPTKLADPSLETIHKSRPVYRPLIIGNNATVMQPPSTNFGPGAPVATSPGDRSKTDILLKALSAAVAANPTLVRSVTLVLPNFDPYAFSSPGALLPPAVPEYVAQQQSIPIPKLLDYQKQLPTYSLSPAPPPTPLSNRSPSPAPMANMGGGMGIIGVPPTPLRLPPVVQGATLKSGPFSNRGYFALAPNYPGGVFRAFRDPLMARH